MLSEKSMRDQKSKNETWRRTQIQIHTHRHIYRTDGKQAAATHTCVLTNTQKHMHTYR